MCVRVCVCYICHTTWMWRMWAARWVNRLNVSVRKVCKIFTALEEKLWASLISQSLWTVLNTLGVFHCWTSSDISEWKNLQCRLTNAQSDIKHFFFIFFFTTNNIIWKLNRNWIKSRWNHPAALRFELHDEHDCTDLFVTLWCWLHLELASV